MIVFNCCCKKHLNVPRNDSKICNKNADETADCT